MILGFPEQMAAVAYDRQEGPESKWDTSEAKDKFIKAIRRYSRERPLAAERKS